MEGVRFLLVTRAADRLRDELTHGRFSHSQVFQTLTALPKLRLARMKPDRHSWSETMTNALLWGLGVFTPILLVLLVLVLSGWASRWPPVGGLWH